MKTTAHRSRPGPGCSVRSLVLLAALGLPAALAVSCSSGDTHVSARTSFHGDDPPRGDGGLVIIWVHDAPADIQALRLTFRTVTLEGAERVYSVRPDHRADLLSLRRRGGLTVAEILAVCRGVPAGDYDAVTVELEAPELVDSAGRLVGAASIDMVTTARVPISLAVRDGAARSVVLDLRVDESIAAPGDPSRPWELAPVIEATVREGVDPANDVAPLDVEGVVSRLRESGGFVLSLDGDRGELEIAALPDETLPAPGERVIARGVLDEAATLLPDFPVIRRGERIEATVVGISRRASGLSLEVLPLPTTSRPLPAVREVAVGSITDVLIDRVELAPVAMLEVGDRVGVVIDRTAETARLIDLSTGR